MRTLKSPGAWRLLISFSVACSGAVTHAQEQWVPIGPPFWTNTMIQTVGGVTYFTGSALLPICHRNGLEPVTGSGTNLVLTANEEVWSGPCAQCVCYYNETNTSVLGVLPPADYLLTILWNPPGGPPAPFVLMPFSVPSSRTPTLSSWTDNSAGTFHLAVAGVPNASYVIQVSNDASNWTSLATNVGAPFVWAEPLMPQVTNRFYRAWIIGH